MSLRMDARITLNCHSRASSIHRSKRREVRRMPEESRNKIKKWIPQSPEQSPGYELDNDINHKDPHFVLLGEPSLQFSLRAGGGQKRLESLEDWIDISLYYLL